MLARTREGRKSQRRWTRRAAHVIFDAYEPIRCVIQDISHSGARLRFTSPLAGVPRTFAVVLFKDNVQRECELVWTDGRFLGVKFVSQWSYRKSAARASDDKDPHKGAA